MTDILQFWPEEAFEPRPVQVEALEWIAANSSKKYLIIKAPVASGKSHIAVTASNFFGANGVGNAFILTPQKVLQKQYKDTFEEDLAYALYGKNNYECGSKNCTCEIGSLITPKCNSCPYTGAVQAALHAPNIIMNYTLAFLMLNYHPSFMKTTRKLMVIDECHNLEQSLISFSAKKISRRFVEAELAIVWPTNVTTFEQLRDWMEASGYIGRLQSHIESLEGQVDQIQKKGSRLSREDIKVIRKLFRFEEMLDHAMSISTTPMDELRSKCILDYNEQSFEIRNLYARDEFKTCLADKAEKFLFMSGTVDLDGFCSDLGIPKEEAAFISLESPIPVDNRPVVFVPTIRMNYEWSNKENAANRSRTVHAIQSIIKDGHPNDSGVIHTANFKVAEWIKNQLTAFCKKEKITLIDHIPDEDGTSQSRDDAIAQYLNLAANGQRAILISPSCTEGLDLKHELGRFSIVLKVPYGNLGDKWIKRRMELSKEWYSRQALFSTMQAAGRVVRDPTDSGTTYIMDDSWAYLMKTTSKLIPDWWRQAYIAQ